MVHSKEFYVDGFISLQTQTEIILKGQKIGYDVSITEYGAGTFIEFTKSRASRCG